MKTRSGNSYELGVKAQSMKMEIDKHCNKKQKKLQNDFDDLVNLFTNNLFIEQNSYDMELDNIIGQFNKSCSLKNKKKKKKYPMLGSRKKKRKKTKK